MKSTSLTLTALLACTAPSFGAVLSGTSSAADVSLNTQISGSLAGIAVASFSAGVGPLNDASGVSPAPYTDNPNLTGGLSVVTGVAIANADVEADDLLVTSDVDGLDGNRNVNGLGILATAGASLDLNLVGLTSFRLLEVVADNGTTSFTSNSSVAWNGTSFTPTASTNLIGSGTDVTVRVLGTELIFADLVANVPTLVQVNVSGLAGVTPLTVVGTISITADGVTNSGVDSLTANASATSLRVVADLDVSALGGGGVLDVQSQISINETQAFASAVPEPGSSLLVLAGALGFISRRRRLR